MFCFSNNRVYPRISIKNHHYKLQISAKSTQHSATEPIQKAAKNGFFRAWAAPRECSHGPVAGPPAPDLVMSTQELLRQWQGKLSQQRMCV